MSWLGWIPEVPKVNCEEPTEAVLLRTLEKKLHEALVAEEEAWEKRFEEDVKAGHLDPLAEKAVKNYRQGKYRSVEHILDDDFWESCAQLPPDVRRRVPQKFQCLQQNLRHPSLRFKKVGALWSIRISRGYRAFSREEDGNFIWFWIGTHAEYERRI